MSKRWRYLHVASALVVGTALAASAFAVSWTAAPAHRTCVSCHQMQEPYDALMASAHREVSCSQCHGGSFSGIHTIRENARRVWTQAVRPEGAGARLSEAHVVEMMQRCRSCHAREYADWSASGHSVTYTTIFLDEAHNGIEPPNNDCLRCHGMYFDGDIGTLLAPVPPGAGASGLRFTDATRVDVPAIPCQACHAVHVPGALATLHGDDGDGPSRRRSRVPAVGFYDRAEKRLIPADLLPVPRIRHRGEPVAVSNNAAQRVCTQCHAPNAAHQAGTADDRTPRGVHEGLGCQACHRPHSNEAVASCASCHPAQSNCGLDVTRMNTTYLSPESPNDVHFVSCQDCHAVLPRATEER
jgi:hypothetical protein